MRDTKYRFGKLAKLLGSAARANSERKKWTQLIVFYLPVLVSPVLSVCVSILAVMKLVSQIGPIHRGILFSRIFKLPLIRVHFEVD